MTQAGLAAKCFILVRPPDGVRLRRVESSPQPGRSVIPRLRPVHKRF